MRGISDALKQRLRRADPTARIMIEGRIETAAEIKQRYDQWGEADSLTGLERLQSGGVRLTASNANGPLNTVHNASARTLEDAGPPAGPYITPMSPKGFNGDPLFHDLTRARMAAVVHWSGTESNALELTQVQAYLNPQFDLTVDKHVARWRCELFALTSVISEHGWVLQPLATSYADATGQAAGFVNFDFTEERPRVRESPIMNAQFDLAIGGAVLRFGPVTVAFFSGLKSDGTPSDNIALGYDNTTGSAASAAGSYLYGWLFSWLFRGELGGPASGLQSPGAVYSFGNSSSALPSVKFIIPSHTAATITFSDGTPDVNFGVSTPEAQIELVGRGQTPSGTSITYEVKDDAAVWRAFTDGQTLDQLTGFSGNYSSLKMRATLTPNSVGDATPILRGLGARAVSTTNLSDIAEVESVSWAFDPLDHHAEIPELRLSAIHDGERDFRDAISLFLSQQSIGAMLLRLYCGDASLGKSDWVHLDDFLIDDYDLAADRAYITGVSPLALVRGALPKLTDQGTAYPDSTVSNPGAWTEVGGATNLYAALADNEGGIGLVPWDDTTAIQSAVNPSSAAITVGLQNISQPTTPIVGQVIIQFRFKLVSGTSLTLACALMQGATQKSSVSVTVSSSNVVQGTLTPTVTELASISDWTDLRLRFTANGTGQIQVTWARLVVLPVRLPLTYSLASPATVVQDLLSGQVGLDGRYRGPDLQGVAGIGTGTTITLGKTIASPIGGSTDLTIAKQELDAVSYIAGAVHTSSQGRVVARQLYDVTVGTDGTVTYAPKTRAPGVFIPREELTPTSVRPGFQYRVPEFDVDWGFIESSGSYLGMAHGVSDVALQNLGEARIVPQTHAPETVSRWVQDQGLANGLAFRQVQAFGMGYMGWRFLSEYAYPELELGDVIAIETDRFLAYDPSAARQIAGANWVLCIVTGVFDPWGHDIAVWVPGFASIGGASNPPAPPITVTDDLLYNGDFENGLSGWSVTLGTAVIDQAHPYDGLNDLHLTASPGSSATVLQVDPGKTTRRYVQVQGGTTVRLEMLAGYVTGSTGTGADGRIDVTVYDSAKQQIVLGLGTTFLSWSTETSYTRKTLDLSLPTNAAFLGFSVSLSVIVSGTAEFYVDRIHCTPHATDIALRTAPGVAVDSLGTAALVLAHHATKATSSTGEVSVASLSLPANALPLDGQTVRLTAVGRVTGTGNGTVRLKFGATQIAQLANIAAGGQFKVEMMVVRTAAATQQATGWSLDSTNGAGLFTAAPTETLSGAVTVDFRGLVSAGTATLTYDTATVDYVTS